MKPEHVLKFAEYKLDQATEYLKATETKYQSYKEEYENKFLPKLFGWKYEDSGSGDRSWMGSWDFWITNDRILYYIQMINHATYCEKMKHSTMNIDKPNLFYKWCTENNIPY